MKDDKSNNRNVNRDNDNYINNVSLSILEVQERTKMKTYEYFENCNVAKFTGKNCSNFKNCQTWKYYNKYSAKKLFNVPDEIEGEYLE